MRRWGLAVLGAVAIAVALFIVFRVFDVLHDRPAPGPDRSPLPSNSARATSEDRPPTTAALSWIDGHQQAKRIAGRVTADGVPVAGATVRIATFTAVVDAAFTRERRTRADGTFDFGPQPATGTWLTASAPTKAETVALIDPGDPRLDPPPDHLEIKLLPCTGGIFGIVSDASGNALVGARVHRREPAAEVVTSDAAGKFDLCLARGPAVVFVEADGYGTLAVDLKVTTRTRRDFVLVAEATLTGRCVRDEDEQPVADAVVTIMPDRQDANAGDRAAFRSIVTASDGTFHVTGLPSGRFAAVALSEHGRTANPVPIIATAGQVNANVVLRLQQTATVTGTLMSAGKPLGSIQVFLVNDGPRPHPGGFSKDDGTFEIRRVPSGKNRFAAWPYQVVSPTSLEVVTPTTAGVVVEVARMAAIRGRVEHDGRPVENASIGEMSCKIASALASGRRMRARGQTQWCECW